MCQGRFLQKDENQGWDIFEDQVEKSLQWKPTPKKSRNTNHISSKRDLYSIQSSITTETKISSLMRKLEAIETKELVPVNQVSPNQFSSLGCTYCQAMNHLFEECPVFNDQQIYPELMKCGLFKAS